MKNKFNSEKIKLIYNSDEYWKKVWNKIDKSTNEIFIITYDMNNSLLANLTLHKLINAAERGVKIFLIVEEINFFMKKNLISKLKEKGGIILKPNDFKTNLKTFNFFKIFNRFHNKIKLIDNDLFIGSLNCNDDYANYYGKNKFVDLNFYVKNTICKNKIVNFFKNVILNNFKRKNVFFNFNNFNNKNNENFNNENNEKFLIESFKNNEISNEIIKSFSNAKKKITIIQSYYMNFKNIEKILLNLLKNGVEIEIITAKIRDPFLLKFYKNEILFENLIKNGAKVYEFLDKSFHCKVYNIDNKIINLGSFNHDIISLWFNNESNYLVKKNEKNKFLFEKFEEIKQKMIKNSKRVLLNNNNNFNYKFIFKFGYISINYFLFSIGKLLGNSNKLF